MAFMASKQLRFHILRWHTAHHPNKYQSKLTLIHLALNWKDAQLQTQVIGLLVAFYARSKRSNCDVVFLCRFQPLRGTIYDHTIIL